MTERFCSKHTYSLFYREILHFSLILVFKYEIFFTRGALKFLINFGFKERKRMGMYSVPQFRVNALLETVRYMQFGAY